MLTFSYTNSATTLEYRISGWGENNWRGWKWFDITIIGGGGWNDRGGTYLLYIYVNSDVTDTFTDEPWFC